MKTPFVRVVKAREENKVQQEHQVHKDHQDLLVI